ncbi:MAG: hypothetical protein GYA48_01480 [Chloroflexi bacterium]|nr:hypothetical protein [Chloroflexota bacterium]
MKRKLILVFLLLAATFALAGCKKKAEEAPVYPQWEYTSITARCVFDGGTNNMVCRNFTQGTDDSITTILRNQGLQGWELVDVAVTGEGDGQYQTFIFKRYLGLPDEKEK